MPSIVKSMRVLGDPLRLRILSLVEREELSVAEIQEILSSGQSRVSTHLSQLKRAELVEDRRSGKNVMYRSSRTLPAEIRAVLEASRAEIPEAGEDTRALALILRKRADRMRSYFDELAGRFGKQYVPGRSWRGLAEALLLLMPALDIADLGAGEGAFSQLLARRAKRVIAIDNSERMLEVAREISMRNGLTNIDFRVGDLENPPVADASVDLAFFSQSLHHAIHPQRAVDAAARMLRPGGRIAILDLKRHGFEEARDLYADLWPGFAEAELEAFLHHADFHDIEVVTVDRESEHPHFETVLALGRKGNLL